MGASETLGIRLSSLQWNFNNYIFHDQKDFFAERKYTVADLVVSNLVRSGSAPKTIGGNL